ncbi:MAG: DUF937 domain-containing protein [Oscillospiraceae bacterium]|jgi:hypothetical protein|nr:DUF937 domain-containing protein [Oscillospiraceae bacterium]MBR5065585.1 DUF937 domain-containing protein [Oscillospiraceae bacterium]
MDIKSLTNTLLGEESLEGVSRATGASTGDVLNVLAAALPSLLSGASAQANTASTSAGFANALQSHAASDTSNLLGFLSNADLKDGNAIISHLLGSQQQTTTQQISQQTGVSKKQTGLILACIAPLLMSLLGKSSQNQTNSTNVTTSAASSLMSGLLGGGQSSMLTSLLGGILGGGLGGQQTQAQPQTQTITQQQTATQQTSSFNPLSLLSSLLDVNPNKFMPGNDEEEK